MGPYQPRPPGGGYPPPPYQGGPPGYPPYPPPVMPQVFAPPPQNDGKAIASLVLGILSLVGCFGALAGIPAIILGFMSKRDIARSGGSLGGDGLALGGIITGIMSTLLSIGLVIFYVAIFAAVAASPSTYTPTYTPPYATTAVTPTATTTSTVPLSPGLKPMGYTGSVKVVDVKLGSGTGSTLKTAIALEIGNAKDDGAKVLVITASRTCHACDEIFTAFSNYTLQRSMRDVRIVRVDVDAFPGELSGLGLDKPGLPWFFRFDDTMKVIDSISADEWDDNDAANIAPVLTMFMTGHYKKRTIVGDAGAKKHSLSETF